MAYDIDIGRNDLATLFDLRGDAAALAAHLAAAGLAVPRHPNLCQVAGGIAVIRVGPRRVLLHAAEAASPALQAAVAAIAADPLAAVADVADGHLAFSIDGPDAGAAMAQASHLDTHPAAFPPGSATFTEVFGQTGLVWRTPDRFLVVVERSYADYLEACFRRAAG